MILYNRFYCKPLYAPEKKRREPFYRRPGAFCLKFMVFKPGKGLLPFPLTVSRGWRISLLFPHRRGIRSYCPEVSADCHCRLGELINLSFRHAVLSERLFSYKLSQNLFKLVIYIGYIAAEDVREDLICLSDLAVRLFLMYILNTSVKN